MTLKEQIKFDYGKNKTYFHFGDGDFYFLTKQPIGSAAPMKRALSVPYEKLDLTPFKEGVLKNDCILMEHNEPETIKHFHELYARHIDYDLTELYQLMAERWITKNFDSISLIGAEPKLDLINRLMKYEQYQEYLGINKFQDYIVIPQKYACDNLSHVSEMVKRQLQSAIGKMFLFGVGHVKTGLAYRFKQYHHGLYIDVGAGIDMLAGIYDYQRPFGNIWVNYRLKNYNYSDVDLMYFQSRSDDVWLS